MPATGTGGTLDTLIFAYETCPPLVATMFAVPSARATTTPPVETAAMVVSSVDHWTGNPSTAAPVESRGVPINCVLVPTTMASAPGVTSRKVTGVSMTVTRELAALPSTTQLAIVLPPRLPVTLPVASIVATPGSAIVHEGVVDTTTPRESSA